MNGLVPKKPYPRSNEMLPNTFQSGFPMPKYPWLSRCLYAWFSLILWPGVNGLLKQRHWKYMSAAALMAPPSPNIASRAGARTRRARRRRGTPRPGARGTRAGSRAPRRSPAQNARERLRFAGANGCRAALAGRDGERRERRDRERRVAREHQRVGEVVRAEPGGGDARQAQDRIGARAAQPAFEPDEEDEARELDREEAQHARRRREPASFRSCGVESFVATG